MKEFLVTYANGNHDLIKAWDAGKAHKIAQRRLPKEKRVVVDELVTISVSRGLKFKSYRTGL